MTELKITDISYSYDAPVLQQVALEVGKGEVVCLLGPSGCGKSTLLRLIAGLEPLQQGKVVLCGKDVSFVPPEQRKVGMVFQNPSLFPHLTALENVAFGLTNMPKVKRHKVAQERLAAVGMAGYEERYPHMLSGGQQQRVALARALAPQPTIMLLDEPFANLDSELRKKIREETLQLLKALGVATLLVTHDPEEALRMGDRIYVMQEGQMVQDGIPEELYHQPRNAFVGGFFGEMNTLPVTVKGQKADTPFGRINVIRVACENVGKEVCEPIADGAEATLFIRPEALLLAEKGVKAKVERVRFLGISSLITVRFAAKKWAGLQWNLRTSRAALPNAGETVYLTLDERQVFIFGE